MPVQLKFLFIGNFHDASPWDGSFDSVRGFVGHPTVSLATAGEDSPSGWKHEKLGICMKDFQKYLKHWKSFFLGGGG